jgi:hypothetical protein
MPPQPKIIKLGLESRTLELYNNQMPLSKIAETLSNESNDNITKSMVFEYLKSDARFKAEAIEKKAELAAKVAEIEVNSISDWLDDIKFISDLAADAWAAGEYRAAVMAAKVKVEARESLNKQLGRISNNSNVQINNINAMKLSDIPMELLQKWREEAHGMHS